MKTFKCVLPRAAVIFLIFTVVCGVVYTGVVTGIAQLIFPKQANGSIIEADGKKYGSELLAQQFTRGWSFVGTYYECGCFHLSGCGGQDADVCGALQSQPGKHGI